jgi:hypothetical protein
MAQQFSPSVPIASWMSGMIFQRFLSGFAFISSSNNDDEHYYNTVFVPLYVPPRLPLPLNGERTGKNTITMQLLLALCVQ